MARSRLVKRLSLALVLLPASWLATETVAGATAEPPLLLRETVAALAEELSGSTAKHTVKELTLHHRQRGSRGYRAAAEAIRDRARAYGLEGVEIISLPANGQIFYGTQRSRPAWDADFAELWELAPAGDEWHPAELIASYSARPITLAEDSFSGEVTADLVDVAAGTSAGDYDGKEVRGRLVLTSSQPGAVAELAVARYGAAGIVSYAQNQKTAWWGEDENQVRWGHLDSFSTVETFGFMVSLKQARAWRQTLASGGRVRLRARVEAGQHAGSYDIPTAVIRGADPVVGDQEIAFSCHLDHQRPGANDNASGCAAILEVARALNKLIADGRIERPRRTIRFIWPAEIEGTISLLNSRPELVERTLAVIHMDMVGGDAATTKAVFHITRSPRSMPSFINDVAEEIGRFVNEQSDRFAGSGRADFPLADPEGGKEALLAQMVDFSMGSDHQIWSEGSFRVPAIYLNDWPDRYIHTHADDAANIDPTKLLRAAFIGAASGLYLADLDAADVPELMALIRSNSLRRSAAALARAERLVRDNEYEAANLLRFQLDYERRVLESIDPFAPMTPEIGAGAMLWLTNLGRLIDQSWVETAAASQGEDGQEDPSTWIYRRAIAPKGPMDGFGYSYLEDRLAALDLVSPGLLAFEGLSGSGPELGYEALNLVDGTRTVVAIRDDLSAIYGPVPIELVVEFLATLERIGVLTIDRS
jgi:aminopeptidase YwaD